MVTKAEKRALRLKQRNSEIKEQRSAAAKRRRNKKIINYSIVGVIVLLIAFGGYTQLQKRNSPGEYDDFAICLTNVGLGMYGTDWCPYCQEQKRLFGNSFRLVTYINCDANPTACNNQGVTTYPTWISADGSRVTGVQTLEALSERTNCPING